jgi:hypothetical protein
MQSITRTGNTQCHLSRHERQRQARLEAFSRSSLTAPVARVPVKLTSDDVELRAISSPRRGIGPATLTRLIMWARDRHDGNLVAAAVHAAALDRVPSEPARRRLVEFGVGLSHVRSELEAGRSLGHVVIATVTLPGGLVRHYEQVRYHS